MKVKEKRLNLKLKPDIDAKLREIAKITGLKLVTIISRGIESEYRKRYTKDHVDIFNNEPN